jgi:hypothetical protein
MAIPEPNTSTGTVSAGPLKDYDVGLQNAGFHFYFKQFAMKNACFRLL